MDFNKNARRADCYTDSNTNARVSEDELTCRFYQRSDSINLFLGDNVAEGHSV